MVIARLSTSSPLLPMTSYVNLPEPTCDGSAPITVCNRLLWSMPSMRNSFPCAK